MVNNVLLSINCITYNHEKYIAKTLDGFLDQKTTFPYEVLIHEDASTDRTAEIIASYETKYPTVIKPIYQRENQYSKGIDPFFVYNHSRAMGKYVAVCEGDDYWIDPSKIQKQVGYLESHPACSASFHTVQNIPIKTGSSITYLYPIDNRNENKYFIQDIIAFRGQIIHLSSLVFRKELLDNLPLFINECIVGDLPITLLLANFGYIYYFPEVMSARTRGVPNSASERLFKGKERAINARENFIKLYEEFDRYTDLKYHQEVCNVIRKYSYENAKDKGEYCKIKNEFSDFFSRETIKERIRIRYPRQYERIKKVHRLLKRET